MFQNTYNKRRVFITGNTGFKGSWLSYWLQEIGAIVAGYSLANHTNPSHFKLLNQKIPTTYADILDFESLKRAINDFQPEIVFHLAAQPLVRASYAKPLETFKTNIIGTANLLEVIRGCPTVKALVNVTTDKVYENKERTRPYSENEALGGYDPYSASKAGSEIVTASYRRAFFHPKEFGQKHSVLVSTARSGNVIGGGDWAQDRLIPDIIKAASSDKSASIRNPNSSRPWQHVLEPLSGYLLLGSHQLRGNTSVATAWNFGPDATQEYTVEDVLSACQKEWPQIKYRKIDNEQVHEARKLQLDSSKALKELSWKNTWDYKTCIEKTISWYRSYYEKNEVITGLQFAAYIQNAREQGQTWVL